MSNALVAQWIELSRPKGEMWVRFLPRAPEYIHDAIIMASVDEYLDLVDKNDNVVGKKLRSDVYAENSFNFRVINVFIINSKGELWIPRRVADKNIFPLCLDMSVGGHVKSGETYEDTLQHEMKDEVGVDMNKVLYRFLGKLSPQKNNVSAFMKVYEVSMNTVPDYNRKDFCEYFWLTPKELLSRIAEGEKTKEDLPKLVKYFYG
jgi:isopentenyldiphosphate isomerase